MGFEPHWGNNTATLSDMDTTIIIPMGQSTFTVNGRVITPDVPQQNIQGRVLIPLRAVTEAIGGTANWDPVNRIAIITPPDNLMARVIENIYGPQISTPAALTITTATLPSGRVGQAYNQTLQATGTTGGIIWAISEGHLPSGLSLNSNTGAITGTPTVAGTFKFTVNAQAQAAAASGSRALSITIEGSQHSTITLPNRRATLAERNTWITEYTNLGGATPIELEVVRLINLERTSRNLVPVAIDQPLMMAARFYAQLAHNLPGTHTGHNFGPYATTTTAQHGASSNVAQAFGASLRRNHGNWHSNGSATAETLVEAWMANTAQRNYILMAEHRFIGFGQFPGGISYLFMNDRASTGTQQLTVTFNANGGTGTMQPQIFQHGVAQNIRANTFTRTGFTFAGWRTTPTGPVQYNNNQSMNITADRTLYAVWVSGNAPNITTAATLPGATIGVAYSQQLAATGVTPITWSHTAGTIPPGLTINSTGLISGTPTTAATAASYTFTIRAQNTAGYTTRAFTISMGAGVPNVVGRPVSEAQSTLWARDLEISIVHQYTDTILADQVVSQSPVAGATPPPDRRVTLTIARPNTAASISATASQTTFFLDETFTHAHVAVTATLLSGIIRPATNFTLSGGGVLSTLGEHTITITYQGQTATVTVNVIQRPADPGDGPGEPGPGDDNGNGNGGGEENGVGEE